jgi:transketolase
MTPVISPRRMTPAISPKQMRRIILEQSRRADVGHIGSCLCVVDIISALYSGVLSVKSPADPDRDRFILSKGHAGLALYAALVLKGWIEEAALQSFCGNDTLLAVHPVAELPGVDFSSGSLGQGLGFACGAALAAHMQGSQRRVFCLISDGECNEGSVWEAAMFAAHHKLSNLHVVVDVDGQQALGRTSDIMDISNLAERWETFGWRTSQVDGHSVAELTDVLSAPSPSEAPHVVIARTVFGKGVSYMEAGIPLSQPHLPVQPMNWHYLPMSEHEYQVALKELERSS